MAYKTSKDYDLLYELIQNGLEAVCYVTNYNGARAHLSKVEIYGEYNIVFENAEIVYGGIFLLKRIKKSLKRTFLFLNATG